ncbi:MAG: hypothetical protein ACK5OX_04930 [Desertimonas sp.]
MTFAYADPPYYGCAKHYDAHHPQSRVWNSLDTHRALIERLNRDYPDGWALSMTSGNLHDLLPLVPRRARVMAWVKPFAAFKRNVRVAYTWEPVIVVGGRVSSRDGAPPTRDHIAESITMRRGLTGAKPERFCGWVLDVLGWIPGDRLDDLFPGTGVMGEVVQARENALLARRARDEAHVRGLFDPNIDGAGPTTP